MVKWRKEQMDAAVREPQLEEEGHQQQRQNGAAEQEERKKGKRAITKKVEVEDERKGDTVDGEGKRGEDVEKVYCSGSTAGRDHGLAWLSGEQEDGDGAVQQKGSKGAVESGAPPGGEDGSGDSRMAGGSCEDGEYWFEETEPDGEKGVMRCRQEREDQEYGKIVNRLMQHWVGLAVKGKLQWYLVRRRWFGLVVVQFYGMEEGLFRSDTFERTWKKYDGDWEEELKNMGALEGWKRHCMEHGCCGQEGQRKWNDVVASW